MSFVGVGVGFNLGAATGYLFVDASGIRRGLDAARSGFESFESKVAARTAQATKAMNAAMQASTTAVLSSAATTAKLNGLQANTVTATANAARQITASYEQRGKAIAELANRTRAEQARIVAAEEKAAAVVKKRDDMKRKLDASTRQRDRSTDPVEIKTLNRQIGQYSRYYKQLVTDAANANRSLAAIRKSANKNIEDATKRSNTLVANANLAQARSFNGLKVAIGNQVRTYQDLARNQGVAAQRAADTVARAGRTQIKTIEELEIAQRRLNAADQRVKSTKGLENVEAVKELERATKARNDALARSIDARDRQVRAEATASEKLARIHKRNADNAQREADRLTAAIERERIARANAVRENLAKVQGGISVLALASAAAMVAGIREFVVFEEQLRNISSIAQDTTFVMHDMRAAVLDLGVETGQAPAKLASALYDVVSSGFDGADALKLLNASAKAAVAGMSNVEIAGKSLTAVLNAYKGASHGAALAIENVGHVSDVAFQGVKDGVFSFEELTSQQGDNLTIAAELGVTYEQLISSYVVLTRAGNSLAESTTQINGIMRTFLKPNEDLAKAIRRYGQEVLGVTDLTGASLVQLHGFGTALQFIEDVAGNDADMLGKLFPNVRALRGQVALSGEGLKLYNDELVKMGHASEGAGATQTAFAEQTKAVAFQLRQAKEAFRVTGIQLAGAFGPGLVAAANAAQATAGAITAVNDASHGALGGLLGVSAASLIAAGAIIRIGTGAKETIQSLKRLSELGVFADLSKAAGAFVRQINVMIARMRVFIATSSLARLTLIGGGIALALGLAAFATYKLIKAHQKESEEVKKLTDLYRELNLQMASPSVRQDEARIRALEVEKGLVESITKTLDESDAAWEKVGQQASHMAAILFPNASHRAVVDPRSTVGNMAKGAGPTLVDAFDLNERLKAARISVDGIAEVVRLVDDLMQQTGIDQEAALDSVLGLVAGYNKSIETGTALANADEKLIERIAALKNNTALYTSGLIGASEATDDLTDYVEDNIEKSERYRAGLIAAADALNLATGAAVDAQDPLAVLTKEFGVVGDSAYDLLLRLDTLRDIKLDDFAAEGVTAAGTINQAFLGIDLGQHVERQTVEVIAALDRANKAVADARAEVDKHRQAATDFASTQDLVRDAVGDEGDAYAKLQGLYDEGLITFEQFTQAKAAAIFLYNDSADGIERENAAVAAGLIDMARRTAQQNDAEAAYSKLTDEQKTYADQLRDENFLMAVNILLMAQFLAASDQIPDSVPFELATNFAEVIPGLAQFVNDTNLLNGQVITTELSLRVDPALDSLEGIDAKITETRAVIEQLEQDEKAIKAAGAEVPPGLTSTLNKARDDMSTLEAMREEFVRGVEQTEAGFGADGMPGIPTDEEVEEAESNFGKVEDFFQTAEDAAEATGSAVESVIDSALTASSELGDLSDPVSFLNKQLGLVDGSMADILATAAHQKGVGLMFDENEKAALRWQTSMDKVNGELEDWNETVDQAQAKMSEWEDIVSLLDDTLGEQEDGYNKLRQLEEAGLITNQEAKDAIQASLWLRDRAARGVLEERAAIVKSLPALVDYVAEHDDLSTSYDTLSDESKGFLAALEDEGVQQALNTAVMLRMLEVMNAIPEGVSTKFITDVSAANPIVGALFDQIGFIAGDHSIDFTVDGTAIGEVERVAGEVPPPNTTANVKINTTGEAELVEAAEAVETFADEDVVVRVRVSGNRKALAVLDGMAAEAAVLGYSMGLAFEANAAKSMTENAALIYGALPTIAGTLLRVSDTYRTGGYYMGVQADYGAAQGMIDKVGTVDRAARYVARSMIVAMANELRVASPSREAFSIGGNTTLGFAMGALSKRQLAANAGRDVARAAGVAMKEEAARQNAELEAAGGLVRGDILARQGGGFRNVRGNVAARDLSTVGRAPLTIPMGGGSMTQTNQITIPVNGGRDSSDVIAKRVHRELYQALDTLALKGVGVRK